MPDDRYVTAKQAFDFALSKEDRDLINQDTPEQAEWEGREYVPSPVKEKLPPLKEDFRFANAKVEAELQDEEARSLTKAIPCVASVCLVCNHLECGNCPECRPDGSGEPQDDGYYIY